MPISDDIMDHEVIGRERRRGMALGRAEAREEGRAEGRLEGTRKIVFLQIARRFGPVPDRIKNRLLARSAADMEEFALRLPDAVSQEHLFAS